ncbi:hypothetical protein MRB53_039418 [Persea americana]|nr:hypothetical protein MRB53_039418 [Persea americana]
MSPVLSSQGAFENPSVIKTQVKGGDDVYYAFSTNRPVNKGKSYLNVPIANSTSNPPQYLGVHGQRCNAGAGQMDRHRPRSREQGDMGSRRQSADGSFILYYAGVPSNAINHQHCIGHAISTTVEGPYTAAAEPMICYHGNETIAVNAVTDGQNRYVLYKYGHANTAVSHLQQVAANGHTLIGEPVVLTMANKTEYDEEGFALAQLNQTAYPDHWLLLYVTGYYRSTTYKINYAISSTGIKGPYMKQPEPLLETDMVFNGKTLYAPGGPDFVGNSSRDFVFFADSKYPANKNKGQNDGQPRQMWAAHLEY